jgi:hypothetical protein
VRVQALAHYGRSWDRRGWQGECAAVCCHRTRTNRCQVHFSSAHSAAQVFDTPDDLWEATKKGGEDVPQVGAALQTAGRPHRRRWRAAAAPAAEAGL